MPFSLPAAVTSLITGDGAATRVLANVKQCVDPLLGFVGSTFEVLADGRVYLKRRVANFVADDPQFFGLARFAKIAADRIDVGILATYLPAAFTAGFTSTGNNRLEGTTVVAKLPDGSQGGLLVQGNLNVQGTTTSSTGFKSSYDMGYFWRSAAVVNTRYRTVLFTQNNEGNNNFQMPTLFQPAAAGSIIGIQTWSQGSAGGNVVVQLFKNSVTTTGTPLVDVNVGSAGTNIGNTVSYSKGVLPFNALDFFCTSVAFTVAGNQCVHVRLYVEYSA